jgi:hypothetical protein
MMMAPDIEFTVLWLLAFASCIIAMAVLPYIFWRTPGSRFALVVSLLLVYGFLTVAPLVMWRGLWSS